MTADSNFKDDFTKHPKHTLAAAFRVQWDLVGAPNLFKAIFPLLLLVILVLLLVPVSVVLYLNAQQNAKIDAFYEEVQSLRKELSSLQEKCKTTEYTLNEIEGTESEIEEADVKLNSLALNVTRHEPKSYRRIRRAPSRKLIQCPKNIVAKQFRGGVFQFIPSNGYVTVWKEEVWCNDTKNTKIFFNRISGGIEVGETGIYQINAQLTFFKFDEHADFVLTVKTDGSTDDVEVSRCRVSKGGSGTDLSPKTCSTSLLLCLNKKDRIFVFVQLPNLTINLDKVSSFIGMARLTKLKSCPAIKTVMNELK